MTEEPGTAACCLQDLPLAGVRGSLRSASRLPKGAQGSAYLPLRVILQAVKAGLRLQQPPPAWRRLRLRGCWRRQCRGVLFALAIPAA